MKASKKLISLILSIILIVSASVCNIYAVDIELADLSAKTGLVAIGSAPINEDLAATDDELPSKYNSTESGCVLPVRTQADQTCWAFGSLSSMETLLLKNGEEISTLAPQHANFWGTQREDGTGWQRNEYNSGYSYIPLGYLTSGEGPVYESEFPETSIRDDYNSFTSSPEYILTNAVYFNNNTDINVIKELIYNNGSVVGNFNSNPIYLSGGNSFYCNDHSYKQTDPRFLGHCVSVVGWDDAYSKENFAGSISGTPHNDGAWIIKNSWGTNQGNDGYFMISYEDVWIFDSIFSHSYAFTGYDTLTENKKLYQNEIYGATYECNYFATKNYYDEVTYMNVFNFEEENRTLDKVIFETTSMHSDYKVFYIPAEEGTPTNDTSRWTELSSGTVNYTGYICADFENIEVPAGKGAIGIQIDNERAYRENNGTLNKNSIGVCEWLTSGGRYIFKPQAEYGMSYYMQHGSVRDLMEFYKNELKDTIGGTFVIKALTENEVPVTEPESTAPTETDPIETAPTESTAPTEPTTPDETTPSAPTTGSDPTESTAALPTEVNPTTAPLIEFEYLLGDADLNGIINVRDATLIQKHAADLETLSYKASLAANVDGNNRINVTDATTIQKYIVDIPLPHKVGELFKIFI